MPKTVAKSPGGLVVKASRKAVRLPKGQSAYQRPSGSKKPAPGADVPVDRNADPYGGRFAIDPTGGSVLTGYQQATDRLDRDLIRRNIKPYKAYGFDQSLTRLQDMTDQQRFDMATKAVLAKNDVGAKKKATGGTKKTGGGSSGGGKAAPKKPTAPAKPAKKPKAKKPKELPPKRGPGPKELQQPPKPKRPTLPPKPKKPTKPPARRVAPKPPPRKPAPPGGVLRKPPVKKPPTTGPNTGPRAV